MASSFKSFLNGDIATTRTLLHEQIPLTGSILSGTYNDLNIKNYTHGLYQSVFDFPYLSASSNHIFDITAGYHTSSALASSTNVQNSKKINMYNSMAQTLMGHDITGSIQKFDADGNLIDTGTKINECLFLNFSRLLTKDEIKKGSFSLAIGANSTYSSPFTSILTVTDAGAENDFRVSSPTGEFGILSASAGGAYAGTDGNCGLIFYQAGIAVLTGSIFMGTAGSATGKLSANADMNLAGDSMNTLLSTSAISGVADALRHRVQNLSFNNTTELNSTIYFCRANHNDFNYSSNPTFLSGSKIVVKNNTMDAPITFISEIGLYSSDNELLGVAKLSEVIRKSPDQEVTIRVRIDQ